MSDIFMAMPCACMGPQGDDPLCPCMMRAQAEKPKESCELCGDQGPLFLHARCHLTAPLQVSLENDELILRCYLPECGQEVARFRVVR